jgi:hypothetical protein
MKRFKLLVLSIAASFAGALSLPLAANAAATDYTLFGEATTVSPGNGSETAVQTVSNTEAGSDGYGGIDFELPDGTTFADLATLSTDFNVTDDNCGAGSPRFQINTPDGSIWAYLGTGPDFNTCAANTWVNSGDLLAEGMTLDTSQIGGTQYDTYANALADFGALAVTGIQLVTDSGWNAVASGGDGEQTVLFDNVVINETTYTFDAEVVDVPTNAEECKKGGWQTFGLFKNQGDCVSFVATGGLNLSSGLSLSTY